jgi:hypothetical protein
MGIAQAGSERVGALEPGGAPAEPAARQAVGQLSAVVLVSLLLVLIASCVLLLLALRRRWRQSGPARGAEEPADAWSESGRRVGLEEGPDVPREPGTG